MIRTRRSVHAIEADPTDNTLVWYSRAIGEMKQRPLDDPLGWRFQGAVHAYDRASDPYQIAGESMPSGPDERRFWHQCQHGSWFFLPWHRMYLFHFERIVLSEVIRLGGPSTWALPYWNYSQDVASRLLPVAFRDPTFADGSTNHLYVSQRTPAANSGGQFLDDIDVDIEDALRRKRFAGTDTGDTGFGGPRTGFSHFSRPFGGLEQSPHNNVHVQVSGFMLDPRTAALDPIFWLHHANIDRLWEAWKRRDATHVDPTETLWSRGVEFWFHDASGHRVKMRSEEVTDPTVAPLEYTYDDLSDPLPESFVGSLDDKGSDIVQLVGATPEAFEVDLDAGSARCVVRVPRPKADSPEMLTVENQPSHVYLSVEQITCQGLASSLDVYLGLSPDDNPADHSDKRVARLALFGIREASNPAGPHGGSGLLFNFEVTDAIRRLDDVGDEDFKDVMVTFRPIGDHTGSPVHIGRVSLYAE